MLKHYCLLFAFTVGLHAADASDRSWYGTWKMDESRSHTENAPAMKSVTLVIQKEGDNDVLDFSFVDAEGKPRKGHLTQPHTGGEVSGLKPTEQYDGATVAVPDDHHWIYSYKKNGKTVFKRYVTLSADGKTHEAKMTGKSPDGKTSPSLVRCALGYSIPQ